MRWSLYCGIYHLFPTSLCGTLQQYHQEKRMAETSSTTAGAQTLLRGLAVLNAVYNGCHDLKVSASSPARPEHNPSFSHRSGGTTLPAPCPNAGLPTGCQADRIRCQSTGKHLAVTKLPSPFCNALPVTPDTVHLGIVEGDEVLYLEKINSQRGLEMRSRRAIACHWQSPASARH